MNALFFACSSKDKDDTQDKDFIIFKVPKEKVKFSDSDAVSILSNMAFISSENMKTMQKKIRTEIQTQHGRPVAMNTHDDNGCVSNQVVYCENDDVNSDPNGDSLCTRCKKDCRDKDANVLVENENAKRRTESKNMEKNNELFFKIFDDFLKNHKKDIENIVRYEDSPLFKQIIKEHTNFSCNFNIKDVHNGSLCVIPKKSNARIIAQQGAFLLFGINYFDKAICADLAKSGICHEIHHISGGDREKIIAELNQLGISALTLFPDLLTTNQNINKKFGSASKGTMPAKDWWNILNNLIIHFGTRIKVLWETLNKVH